MVKDFKNEYFIEKLELFYGFYMFVVLGVLYGFVVVFEFVVLIKNCVKYEKEVNVVRLLNWDMVIIKVYWMIDFL